MSILSSIFGGGDTMEIIRMNHELERTRWTWQSVPQHTRWIQARTGEK